MERPYSVYSREVRTTIGMCGRLVHPVLNRVLGNQMLSTNSLISWCGFFVQVNLYDIMEAHTQVSTPIVGWEIKVSLIYEGHVLWGFRDLSRARSWQPAFNARCGTESCPRACFFQLVLLGVLWVYRVPPSLFGILGFHCAREYLIFSVLKIVWDLCK